jgi:hypothetical protein
VRVHSLRASLLESRAHVYFFPSKNTKARLHRGLIHGRLREDGSKTATYTHTQTHTQTHKQTHTHTHTHTQTTQFPGRISRQCVCALGRMKTQQLLNCCTHTHTVPAAFALKLHHPLLQPFIGSHQTRSCLVILGLGPAQQRIPHAGIWRCALPTTVLDLGFRLRRAALPPRLGSNTILAQQQGTPLLYRQGDVKAEHTFADSLRCSARNHHSPGHGRAYARLSLPAVHASGAVPLLRAARARARALSPQPPSPLMGRAAIDWAVDSQISPARFAGPMSAKKSRRFEIARTLLECEIFLFRPFRKGHTKLLLFGGNDLFTTIFTAQI